MFHHSGHAEPDQAVPLMQQRLIRDCQVPAARAGERLDVVATALLGDFSREQIKRWIRTGELTIDDAPSTASTRLLGDERLQLDALLIDREDWQTPQAVAFAIVHEDASLLVINKPPGVVVHPGAGVADGTLVNGLLARFPELAVVPRAGIVHRLDKETSGLMLIARTLSDHARLVRMMAQREVGRRYVVLVHGAVQAAFEVDAPIGRHPRARTSMAVVKGGRPAQTRFTPLAQARGMTLLEAELSTGRTHQIRVHLAHVGLPVVGDARYGRGQASGRGERVGEVISALPTSSVADTLWVNDDDIDDPFEPTPTKSLALATRPIRQEPLARQALHAWRLELLHPATGERLIWRALPPPDLSNLLSALGMSLLELGREG